MKEPITMKDFYDFLEKSQHFRQLCPAHSQFYIKDYISEIVDEIQLQVINWYDNNSDYPKPEDILQDYIHCTAEEAHRFLPLFVDFISTSGE